MKGRPARTNHGEYGYAQKYRCPCEPCRVSVRRYAKRLAYDAARGVRRTVDASPVREHVQILVDAGASENQVARAAGVTRSQVARLIHGNPVKDGAPVEWLLVKTAEALLAVRLVDALAQPGFVSAVGTHRRIQALAARGYSKDEIGAAMGISGSAIYGWLGRTTLTNEVANKMKTAYARMCMGEGTSETMRWRALREGWMPPLAWDDDTIDDPDAEPDRSAVKCAVDKCHRAISRGCLCSSHHQAVRAVNGYRSSRHFREAVLRLSKRHIHDRTTMKAQLADFREIGMTPEQAAQALGRGVEYVRKNWNQAVS